MWFLFGVISLFVFTIYFGKKRYESNWAGISASTQGVKYTYLIQSQKQKVSFIQLGCLTTANPTMDFSIKHETKLDKFFKFIGISVEHQVGKDAFDNALYIISDHSTICKTLSQSNVLQNEIISVIDTCKKHAMKFRELHIRNQRIWIKLTPLSKKSATDAQVIAKDIIPKLNLISDLFTVNLARTSSPLKDPFYFKAAVFLAISSGMGAMGAFHLMSLDFIKEPFTVEVSRLFSLSFALGTAIIGVLIFMMFVVLGKTARTHLILVELLTIGYFGAVSSSFTLARDINIEWDSAQPEYYLVKLHKKTTHSSRRRSTSYYLHVDDWRHPNHRKTISVSSSKYRSFKIGEKLKIDQHPGYLGFKWVKEIKSDSHDY